MTPDLFGNEAKPPKKRKTARARGYAWKPGTGPDGETCGGCAHCVRRKYTAGRYFKCQLMRKSWGKTRMTDILFRSPACKFWEAKDSE